MAKNAVSGVLSRRIAQQASAVDTSYDAMFGLKQDEKIVSLDVDLLIPHPADPFRYYSDAKLRELAESIGKVGLLEPILVRPTKDGKYEILSGKNRTNAVRQNGGQTIRAIVKDVDDCEAVLMITEANLKHREILHPSEKGWAYRLQLEAIRRQGERGDLGAVQIEQKSGTVQIEQKLGAVQIEQKLDTVQNEQRLDAVQIEQKSGAVQIEQKSGAVQIEQKWSRRIVAELNDVKDSEIQRYIRLTYLISELLEMVDEGKIPIMAAYRLSYLDVASQRAVLRFLQETDAKLTIQLAKKIRESFEEDGAVSVEKIHTFSGDKPSENGKTVSFKINRDRLRGISEKIPEDKLEELFLEFLKEKFSV